MRANSATLDQQKKQIGVLDRIISETLKVITREREEMDAKSNSRQVNCESVF
jgi:hypothetical protein